MKSVHPARPSFSKEEAEAIVLKLWDVRGAARELPSERDQRRGPRRRGRTTTS